MTETKDIFVTKFQKSPRQLLYFGLRTFKERRFVDIRTYVAEDGKGEQPTSKGVAAPPDLWAEFMRAVGEVDRALREQGWLSTEGGRDHPVHRGAGQAEEGGEAV
ncbi:MAG: transcriptional coactivator p15/PC4 family protein [Desulfobaccales bacterium]